MEPIAQSIHRELARLSKKASNGMIGPLHIEGDHGDLNNEENYRVYTDLGECVTVSQYQEEDNMGFTHTLYSFIDHAEFEPRFTPVSEEEFLRRIENL